MKAVILGAICGAMMVFEGACLKAGSANSH